MIYNYTVVKEAFKAITERKKTVEIRLVNEKKAEKGDHICFHEYLGDRKTYVLVDKVEYFNNIDELLKTADKEYWRFEPEEILDEVIQKEFYEETYGKKVKAIYFHAPLVSIIMPGYNSGRFLEATLKCIADQTFKDFELVYLDDSSDDDSFEIIKEYAEQFPVNFVPHDVHQGPAKLRTEGIEKAIGKYIIFLDSDDLFEKDYLEEMVDLLETSDADMALAEYDSFISDQGYYGCPEPAFEDEFIEHCIQNIFEWKGLPWYLIHWTNVPWNKMYRYQFIKDINASFQDLPCSNDVYFSHYTMIFARMQHIKSIKAMVHYRIGNKKSISEKHDYFSEIKAYEKLLEDLKDADDETMMKIYEDQVFGIMKCIRWGSGERHREFFEYIKQDILYDHHFFAQDYINEKHFWLKSFFSTHDYNDDIFKVGYHIIYASEKRGKEIQKLFDDLAEEVAVGILHRGKDIEYLIKRFDHKGIRWITSDEWETRKLSVILCTSMLQLTEIEYFVRMKKLKNIKVINLLNITKEDRI